MDDKSFDPILAHSLKHPRLIETDSITFVAPQRALKHKIKGSGVNPEVSVKKKRSTEEHKFHHKFNFL